MVHHYVYMQRKPTPLKKKKSLYNVFEKACEILYDINCGYEWTLRYSNDYIDQRDRKYDTA